MSALETVTTARKQLDEAKKSLQSQAKFAVGEALDDIFAAHEDVMKIQWAQKSSPYNDEGMYDGVHGPVINNEDDDRYCPRWTYRYDAPLDPRAKELKAVLEAIGEEILSDIFGDENIVTAERQPDGQVTVTSEYGGI